MDASDQFLGSIWLCHIIIGTGIQSFDLRIDRCIGRQVDDRQRADLSHLSQNLMAALQWFIRIQEDQVHLTLTCQINSRLSRIINEAAEAFLF